LHHPVPLKAVSPLILVPSSNTLVESIMALRAAILNVSISYLNLIVQALGSVLRNIHHDPVGCI
jgi:hypothetical protein